MTVTAHIINDDWNMKSFFLATCEVTSAHTANNIAAELSAVISDGNWTPKLLVSPLIMLEISKMLWIV